MRLMTVRTRRWLIGVTLVALAALAAFPQDRENKAACVEDPFRPGNVICGGGGGGGGTPPTPAPDPDSGFWRALGGEYSYNSDCSSPIDPVTMVIRHVGNAAAEHVSHHGVEPARGVDARLFGSGDVWVETAAYKLQISAEGGGEQAKRALSQLRGANPLADGITTGTDLVTSNDISAESVVASC